MDVYYSILIGVSFIIITITLHLYIEEPLVGTSPAIIFIKFIGFVYGSIMIVYGIFINGDRE